jgi:uncharacterized protein (DUF924 family)
MQSDWAAQILRYWFDELQPAAWFRRDERVDAEIRERFGALYQQLAQLRPEQIATPGESIAAVIALATDALALSIAQRAIATGFDAQLTPQQRLFLYMPFQHAEDRAAQARSIELFTQLGLAENLDYAHRHKEIIDRFWRFPHRNEVLGRESTAQEREFVATHRGF